MTSVVATAGVILLAAFAPFEMTMPIVRLPGQSLSNLEALLCVVLAAWGAARLASRRLPTLPRVAWAWFALIAAMAIASAFAPADRMNAWHMTGRFAAAAAVLVLTIDGMTSGARPACHARAPSADATDWERIAALYDALVQRTASPVVELNRAVALGMAFGPAAGLEVADALMREPQLDGYHLLPSVRGDLLYKLGRLDEARLEFERAAGMTRNARERALLARRAEECTQRAARPH
jgi:tetratricopeptide (TPR) repeat protein